MKLNYFYFIEDFFMYLNLNINLDLRYVELFNDGVVVFNVIKVWNGKCNLNMYYF